LKAVYPDAFVIAVKKTTKYYLYNRLWNKKRKTQKDY